MSPRLQPLSTKAETMLLLMKVEKYAEKHHDGHLTILRFTTEWKVFFGAPPIDPGAMLGREFLQLIPGFASLMEALQHALKEGLHSYMWTDEELEKSFQQRMALYRRY